MASSPAAAAATLRNRAATIDANTDEDVEEVGRRAILDQELRYPKFLISSVDHPRKC